MCLVCARLTLNLVIFPRWYVGDFHAYICVHTVYMCLVCARLTLHICTPGYISKMMMHPCPSSIMIYNIPKRVSSTSSVGMMSDILRRSPSVVGSHSQDSLEDYCKQHNKHLIAHTSFPLHLTNQGWACQILRAIHAGVG